MSHILADRVMESTITTGTGVLTLAGAVTGFRRFSAVCAVADTVPYFIEAIDSLGAPTGDYEYGLGTYSAANQLTRTTVYGSSNAGAAVNFSAGSKNVGLALTTKEHGSVGCPAQAWADMTASRALGATYTNTTGRPIMVSGTIQITTTNSCTAKATVGGVVVWGSAAYGVIANGSSVSFIVPPGITYMIEAAGAAATLFAWAELR